MEAVHRDLEGAVSSRAIQYGLTLLKVKREAEVDRDHSWSIPARSDAGEGVRTVEVDALSVVNKVSWPGRQEGSRMATLAA